MKILLMHPEDDPENGPWSGFSWDRIIDLGLGGKNSYERWTRKFRCPVTTMKTLRNGFEDFRRVREILGAGCGQVIDEYGLDWWEIMSIFRHEEMTTLILMEGFARTLGSSDEVYVSRPGLHASLLQCLLSARPKVFRLRRAARKAGLAHYVRVSNRLSASQMIDVFWDKYDSGFQFRGRFARKQIPSSRPVILLPSAYVNVSRTGLAYANTFTEEEFLLVATRRSGWIKNLPPNVKIARLFSYAAIQARNEKYEDIERRWLSLLDELAGGPEFKILTQLGYFNDFPRRFRHALQVRDAWRNVLDRQPVQAVLCADDSNPYTRIPLLLARERGLTNIACHHGALDGRYMFKRSYADIIWAKGKMEKDYLVRNCGVPVEKVEVGAPALPASFRRRRSEQSTSRPHILFISEPFEVTGGRTEEFYRDILPRLAELALRTQRKLTVKLHPTESRPERTAMLSRVLSAAQRASTHVVSGLLSEELFTGAWFGITVLSTVASECAIRGIPCFLCRWLESSPYGYVEQFIRFGVGFALDDPNEIEKIPEYLERYEIDTAVRENCWRPVDRFRLRQLLESPHRLCGAAAS